MVNSSIKIEIECPYCNRIHVHRIEGVMSIPSKPVEAEKELPHDDDTDDLENFRKEDQE